MQNLKNWRITKGWNQSEIASKLGSNQKSYSAYETGRTVIPGEIQVKLKKLGYDGPWPHEVDPSPLFNEAAFLTREEFAEWRGYLKAGMEGVLKRLDDLEDQVRKLSRNGDI